MCNRHRSSESIASISIGALVKIHPMKPGQRWPYVALHLVTANDPNQTILQNFWLTVRTYLSHSSQYLLCTTASYHTSSAFPEQLVRSIVSKLVHCDATRSENVRQLSHLAPMKRHLLPVPQAPVPIGVAAPQRSICFLCLYHGNGNLEIKCRSARAWSSRLLFEMVISRFGFGTP